MKNRILALMIVGVLTLALSACCCCMGKKKQCPMASETTQTETAK